MSAPGLFSLGVDMDVSGWPAAREHVSCVSLVFLFDFVCVCKRVCRNGMVAFLQRSGVLGMDQATEHVACVSLWFPCLPLCVCLQACL